MRIIKIIAFCGLWLLFGSAVEAQVKFRLSLMPDGQAYLVSMYAERTWSAPLNAVGSAQVVVQIPAGIPFQAGTLTSYVPGVTWTDNAYVDDLTGTNDFRFVCFSLNERGTRQIPLQAGLEIPLFSFVNAQGACLNGARLVEAGDPVAQAVIAQDRVNITQNFTVLGVRGNAFVGTLGDGIECLNTTSAAEQPLVNNLKVFPNPTSHRLFISWETAGERDVEKLLITDFLGQQMLARKVPPGAGGRNIELDVSGFPAGLYTICLVGGADKKQFFHFVVTSL